MSLEGGISLTASVNDTMDAKRVYHAFSEFLGLLSGSDLQAEGFIGGVFPAFVEVLDADLVDIPESELTRMVSACCSRVQLVQPELDEDWRSTFLSDILRLMAAGLDPTPTLRRAPGNLDYIMYMQDSSVLASNTAAYQRVAADIATKAAQHRSVSNPSHDAAITRPPARGSALADGRAQAQRLAVMHVAKKSFFCPRYDRPNGHVVVCPQFSSYLAFAHRIYAGW